MPVLETPRLLIRALQPRDHDACQALYRAIGWFDPSLPDGEALERRRSWFEWAIANSRELARLYQPPLGDRAIIERKTGDLIGLVGYVPAIEPYAQLPSFGRVERARNTFELGLFWAVRPEHQRRGVASEAARAMVDNAFERLRLKRIVATTENANVASIAVMRRIGMIVERNPFPDPPHFQTLGWLDADAAGQVTVIRSERPEDAADVRALVSAAFGPQSDTADFVEAVRNEAGACIAEVAIAGGAIVGHAQWCGAPLIVDGSSVTAAYLSCLSVEPALQKRGVGSRLVRAGLRRLADSGYAAATLLGDADYYRRFGFSSELAERIDAPHRARGRGFQAVELVAGALAGGEIRAQFPGVIAPA
jgi:predicted N-acetyltransferase YhbS